MKIQKINSTRRKSSTRHGDHKQLLTRTKTQWLPVKTKTHGRPIYPQTPALPPTQARIDHEFFVLLDLHEPDSVAIQEAIPKHMSIPPINEEFEIKGYKLL